MFASPGFGAACVFFCGILRVHLFGAFAFRSSCSSVPSCSAQVEEDVDEWKKPAEEATSERTRPLERGCDGARDGRFPSLTDK